MGESGGTPARPRGSIETLASGSLRVRVYAGVDVLTGRDLYLKRTVPCGPRALLRAEAVRDELLRQVADGRQPRTNASVTQLVEQHLSVAELDPRWAENQRGYLRRHIAPYIGDRPIGSLDAATLDSFYADLRRCRRHCTASTPPHTCRPSAAGTIRHIHYLLSGAYESAIRWEWIAVNPMRRARKPAAPRPDPQPPTAEQAAALVSEAWRRGIGPLVWLAMTTGARRGELCALRWRDLLVSHTVQGPHDCTDADCRWTLVIRRAIGEAGDGTTWESDTKAHQRRHVALDRETVAVLLEHRDSAADLASRLGTSRADDHFVFPADPTGVTCTSPTLLTRRYQRCAAHLGIRTTLHRLRHYSATELITAGVDVRTVAGRLGHRDATTTLKVYAAWVSAADQHASVALMSRLPARPVPGPISLPPADPRSPHERVAVALHHAWQSGDLTPGTTLTVKSIASTHDISIGTSHRVISLLAQWGVLRVCTGRPSTVLPLRPSLPPPPPQPTPPMPTPSALAALTLELTHLGTLIRTLRTQADPDDLPTLQRLMLAAIRRTAGPDANPDDYELTVHHPDRPTPITIVI